jgi:tetrapyrrole methylase family protein/MazG family protein
VNKYSDEDLRKIETLVEIMDRLREPGGCPWDREQDSKSLRPYVLEEAYEVVEAIDSGQPEMLKEELGDLLLQVIFHARLGKEENHFELGDVIEGICSKLIRRHPHVFDGLEVADSEQVLKNWNSIKQAEKKEKSDEVKSILAGVPAVLPALLKAFTFSRRASQVGFDWDKTEDVIEKIREEIAELEEALGGDDQDNLEEEMGDMLFALTNLSRRMDINPELALERANRKFKSRFGYVEQSLASSGSSPQQSNLQEMDALWEKAKEIERK